MYWANLTFKVLLPIYPRLLSYVIYLPCRSQQRWLSSHQHFSNLSVAMTSQSVFAPPGFLSEPSLTQPHSDA